MNYKLITDSGCDSDEELKKNKNFHQIPLSIYIGDSEFLDDDQLNVLELLDKMQNCPEAPSTASPSPCAFLEKYDGEESVFVVTLSAKLSSTFNHAVMAKKMYLQEKKKKFIHIFDSMSASVGETLVSMKILELIKENKPETVIVEKVNQYIKNMKTLFVLDSLDNLMKSGRLNRLVGKIASVLSVKPIMRSVDGQIGLVEQVRGSKKAFRRLVELIGEFGDNLEEKVLGIAHCNCLEKAEEFKNEVLKRYKFKAIIIVPTKGVTTVYANEGGLIIAF